MTTIWVRLQRICDTRGNLSIPDHDHSYPFKGGNLNISRCTYSVLTYDFPSRKSSMKQFSYLSLLFDASWTTWWQWHWLNLMSPILPLTMCSSIWLLLESICYKSITLQCINSNNLLYCHVDMCTIMTMIRFFSKG